MVNRFKVRNKWCEELNKVKEMTRYFYKNRFMECVELKARLDNVAFS